MPRRPRTRALVLTASLAALLVGGAPAAERGEQERPVTFVTINVLHGGVSSGLFGDADDLEDRFALLVERLRALDPDVVGVQEASTSQGRGNVAARLAAELGFTYAYAPAAFNLTGWRIFDGLAAAMMNFTEGPAILSRYPIVASEARALPRCRSFFDPRVALRAEIATPERTLQVYSTHLSWEGCETDALARFVAEHAAAAPAIVMGDFNATEDMPAIRLLTTGNGFVDVFRALHPSDPGWTVWQDPTVAARTVRRRVDYVFLVPGSADPARALSSRVVLDHPGRAADGRILWPSDHYGVLAEIAFAPDL